MTIPSTFTYAGRATRHFPDDSMREVTIEPTTFELIDVEHEDRSVGILSSAALVVNAAGDDYGIDLGELTAYLCEHGVGHDPRTMTFEDGSTETYCARCGADVPATG